MKRRGRGPAHLERLVYRLLEPRDRAELAHGLLHLGLLGLLRRVSGTRWAPTGAGDGPG